MAYEAEFTVVAVQGELNEAVAQEVLDRQSSGSPPKTWSGPHDARTDPCLAEEDWPKAPCSALIVARGDTPDDHLEIRVVDWAKAAEFVGAKEGTKLSVVITKG